MFKEARRSQGLRALLLISCATVLVGSATLAQSWSRQWGAYYLDSAARELPVARVGAKGEQSAFVRRDGRVFVQGQDGTTICRVPQRRDFVDVEVSPFGYCLGLTIDGSVVPWGQVPAAMLPPPLPSGLRYTAMTGGYYHVVLLRSDGVALACGPSNTWGQLTIPTLPPNATLQKVDANRNYTVGLLSNGALLAWGWNLQGECNVPTAPPGTTYVDISAGYEHAMALRSDGMIDVWGSNLGGVQAVPALPAGTRYQACAAGWGWCVAWRSDGVLVEWGLPPGPAPGSLPLPVAPVGATCLQVQAGNFHGVALWSDGTCSGWGLNMFFECEGPKPSQPGPASQDRFVDVAVGYDHALYLRADGLVEGYGDIGAGQRVAPPLPPGLRYTNVFTRGGHSLALRSDGHLAAFGNNQFGQSTVPSLPVGLGYVDAAVSSSHSVALRSDGIAVAFGQNNFAQCTIPPLPTGLHYVQVDSNFTQTLLLRSDGWVCHAGATHAGLTQWANLIPALPPGLEYVAVGAGVTLHAALRSDGSAVTWSATLPSLVPALPWGVSYVEVSCGDSVAWLRRSDGTIVVAGNPQDTQCPFFAVPRLWRGQSYVSVSATSQCVAARVGPTSIYVGSGHGCAGSRPPTALVPRDTPRIGKTLEVRLFDLPQDVAVMFVGWQDVGPILLGPVGMPGCSLRVAIDAAIAVSGQNNQAKWLLPIPDNPALVGVGFYNQALVLDAAANSLGAVMSDSAQAVIGHW